MSDKIEIQRPIEIKDNSKERVAFDLMNKIAYNDSRADTDESKDRKYWLTLYHQCLKATCRANLETILKEE